MGFARSIANSSEKTNNKEVYLYGCLWGLCRSALRSHVSVWVKPSKTCRGFFPTPTGYENLFKAVKMLLAFGLNLFKSWKTLAQKTFVHRYRNKESIHPSLFHHCLSCTEGSGGQSQTSESGGGVQPRINRQFITRTKKTKTIYTYRQLILANHVNKASLWSVGRNRRTWREPRRHEEMHANSTQKGSWWNL